MNRLSILRFLLLLTLTVAICPAAASRIKGEKDYIKIISRHDVADTVLRAPGNGAFWALVQQTTPGYAGVMKSMRGKGDKDIKRDMVTVLNSADDYFANVPARSDLAPGIDTLLARTGIRDINPLCILTVTREPDVALFSYPNGYIFITEPLYDMVQGDSTMLTAMVAAELAHYTLQHAYSHALWERSRRRKKRFWQGVASVAIASAGALTAIAADAPATIYVGIGGGEITPKYYAQYTPEQILEADIIAYRYMQWAGYGGDAYIDMLRRVGYVIDASAAADPSYVPHKDMPTIDQRIALLEYLRDNPTVRQRVKNPRRKPVTVGSYTDLLGVREQK